VSYGYLVPFGPVDTRPTENADSRLAMSADKGPFPRVDLPSGWPEDFTDLDDNSSPTEWKRLNSGNHGGYGSGEGQNIVFADGHVDFERKPIVGIDADNIFTLMNEEASPEGRWLGSAPWEDEPGHNPYPGEDCFGEQHATSDSLIYP